MITNVTVILLLFVVFFISVTATEEILLFVFILAPAAGIWAAISTTNEMAEMGFEGNGVLTAAGILTMVVASFGFIVGCMEIFLSSAYSSYGIFLDFGVFLMGMGSIAASIFGLTAGILALKRRFFHLMLTGMILVLLSLVWTSFLSWKMLLLTSWAAGLMAIVLLIVVRKESLFVTKELGQRIWKPAPKTLIRRSETLSGLLIVASWALLPISTVSLASYTSQTSLTILYIIGFMFGLTSGVLMLLRKAIKIAVFGEILLLVSAVTYTFSSDQFVQMSWGLGVPYSRCFV